MIGGAFSAFNVLLMLDCWAFAEHHNGVYWAVAMVLNKVKVPANKPVIIEYFMAVLS
ncbi:hypothetical protein [Sphaerospermopsis sp. FACHB-1194]|uniref:hypothetical protein n=1 Tax=Sphaerospermopsis sp. FACHB-1194 TaxID=2692862 RepID=UPI00168016C2|nr:hypothetical protein [Sphaerospermopsis sp. FACHB-1194]